MPLPSHSLHVSVTAALSLAGLTWATERIIHVHTIELAGVIVIAIYSAAQAFEVERQTAMQIVVLRQPVCLDN
jgi:hypothetical protein